MLYDVIIIGGSFAGLSAALPLARARRRVLLVDAGAPRNRFAAHSHNFLGQDGVPPAQIMAIGRQQLSAYPTVAFADDLVERVQGGLDHFSVSLWSGAVHQGRRLILATGVQDDLPELFGLADRWGVSALHCPYCHGYEVADRPLGVLATLEGADQKSLLIAEWGPTTLFTQGRFMPEPEMAARLKARGVTVENSPIVELLGTAPALSAVRLADGRSVPLAALFVGARIGMASPLAEQLSCAMDDGPIGPILRVDACKQTSVPGVYAAGDSTMAMQGASFAAASGTMAGVCVHRSLIPGFN